MIAYNTNQHFRFISAVQISFNAITMSEAELKKAFGNTDLTFHEYEGMVLNALFPAKNLDRIKETVFDDKDLILVTYPKCGKFCHIFSLFL